MFTQVGVKQLTDFLRTVTAASDLVHCTLVNCVSVLEFKLLDHLLYGTCIIFFFIFEIIYLEIFHVFVGNLFPTELKVS